MRRAGTQAERLHSRGFGAQGLVAVLLVLAAATGIAWVYMGMVTRDRWPIRWLEVDGAFRYVSAEQLRTRLAPLAKGSFFTADLAAIRGVATQMPWVASATVQKVWPDTVRVSVYEYQPRAHWTRGRLMAGGGAVFTVPGANEMQGLPWLEGPDGTEAEVFGAWQRYNRELQAVGLEISRIHLDARGAWYLELTSGTRVEIGREDALGRLRRMVSSWPELLQQEQGKVPAGIDLRYSNGFAVRWPDLAPEAGNSTG